jgi:ABC-type multidrug transport system ATPase subunit
VIRARGLEKRYGRKRVLHGVDLDVGRDDVLLVTGPNGSGKTTLLRLCAGLGCRRAARSTSTSTARGSATSATSRSSTAS